MRIIYLVVFYLLLNNIFAFNGEYYLTIRGFTSWVQIRVEKIPGESYFDAQFNYIEPPDYVFTFPSGANGNSVIADHIMGNSGNGTLDDNLVQFLVYYGKYKVSITDGQNTWYYYIDFLDADYSAAGVDEYYHRSTNRYDTHFIFDHSNNLFLLNIPEEEEDDYTNFTYRVYWTLKTVNRGHPNLAPFQVPVTASTKINNNNYGHVFVDEQQVTSGLTIDLGYSTDHIFEPDDNISGNYKFRVWEISDGSNNWNKILSMKIKTRTDLNAIAKNTYPLSVINNLEGVSGGTYAITYSASNITEEFNSGENSYIFSKDDFPLDYYNIEVDQNFNALATNWNFLNWNTGSTSKVLYNQRFNTPTTYTANFKGSMVTNDNLAFIRNGQQKVARAGNTLYTVYTSMNKIWAEKSTDNGATWSICNNVEPISSADSKNPSVCSGRNGILIAYQELKGDGTYYIKMAYLGDDNTLQNRTIYNEATEPYSTSSPNPVIASASTYSNYGKYLIVWKKTSGSGYGLRYATGNWEYDDIVIGGPSGVIPTTSNNSNYPSIAGRKNGTSAEFHLVWQQNRGYGEHIEYQEIIYGSSLSFSSKAYPSSNSYASAGYGPNDANSTPAVDVKNTGEVICSWVGRKISMYSDRTTQRIKNSDDTWQSTFTYYETSAIGTISSPQVKYRADNSFYIAGWQKSNVSRYKLGIQGSNIKSFNLSSSYGMQIIATPDVKFKAMASTNSSLPYYFNLSSEALYWKGSANLNSAREGMVYTDSTSFFFDIGDISLNGSPVEFNPVADTIEIKSSTDLNSILETPDFTLDDNSTLNYSVAYSADNIEKAERTLTENDEITFRVELVDAVTEKVIGIFDNIKFTKSNLKEYTNIAYQVNTEGVGNRKVKMRLVTEVKGNSVKGYSVADVYNSDEGLAKSQSPTEIGFMGSLAVTTYNLEQNYPNPFNPSTTIKYQIPQAGKVTLKIYDILGKEVTTLVNETKDTGRYEVKFDASNLSSGVYIYRLQAGEYTATHKMLMIK